MSLPREGARVTREGIVMSVPMNWGLSPEVAVPYRVHTQGQIEGACTAGTVRQTDQASYIEGSLITRCYGDEAATGGGVQFGTQGAACEPKTWSETVKIQDKCAVRNADHWWMNRKETWGKLTYVEDTKIYPTLGQNNSVPRIQLAQAGPMRAPMPMPMPLEPPPPVRAPAINDNVPVIPRPGRAPVIPSPNSPAPSTDTFLQQYRSTAQRNDDGSWTYFTKL
ncbi:PAAR-like domain-containing protein [Methylobacterium radiotolerans]|uniref:PAAR-like domain-containing protein n=1 Tax=Methylobacterium radiotolerans TaxID=31998 RepID=UPI000D5C76FB|nr:MULTISPECIES: PAAR-like domain-containing protein [Methylobacterium]MDE3750127.1 DUF4150 domain-containing protein [Methylobacterium radiotolerans]PVY95772.1 uncharacterized protein DUF4150 [Methylobacterium organophilum]